MKISSEDKRNLEHKANLLARNAMLGDEQALSELEKLMKYNSYISAWVKKLKKKIKKQNHKQIFKGKKKSTTAKLGGSVMGGLSGITSARTWNKVK